MLGRNGAEYLGTAAAVDALQQEHNVTTGRQWDLPRGPGALGENPKQRRRLATRRSQSPKIDHEINVMSI